MFQLALLAGKNVIGLAPENDEECEMMKFVTDMQPSSSSSGEVSSSSPSWSRIVPVLMSERYLLPERVVPQDLADAIQQSSTTTPTSATSLKVKYDVTPQQFIDGIVAVVANTTSSNGILVGPVSSDATNATSNNGGAGTGTTGNLHSLTSDQITSRVQQSLDATQQFVAAQSTYDAHLTALFICFQITKRSEPSKYLHGLTNLLCGTDFTTLVTSRKLEQALRWLIKDAFRNGLTYDYDSGVVPPSWLTHSPSSVFVQQPNFKISLDSQFMQSSYKGIHRSGWAYVVSGLAQLAQTDADVFLDTYADSTFSWMHDILVYEKVLPYSQPWIAVFHHGMSNSESFDVASAIAKPAFQASLHQCRCLITLSEDLKQKLEHGLAELQLSIAIPPVIALVHPTESVPRHAQFTMDAFTANQERKIIQIGSFYRNSYAIYALPLGGGVDNDDYANNLALQKCHLRAKDSARYFKPADLFEKMASIDVSTDGSGDGSSGTISRSISGCPPISMSNGSISRSISGAGTTNNVYVQGLIQAAEKMDASVTILEHVTHDDYDALLAQNIVFINLIDASAVNTLCETIVRNTPILVNPLPAVVEALGEYYPFYYSSLNEAAAKANSIELIQATTNYLEAMDKSKLQLDVFLNDFQAKVGSLIQISSTVPSMKVNRKRHYVSSSNRKISHKKTKK